MVAVEHIAKMEKAVISGGATLRTDTAATAQNTVQRWNRSQNVSRSKR